MDDQTETPELAPPSRSRRSPIALWAVLAAVAVALGTLAVAGSGDEPDGPDALPIALGANAERDGGASSADAAQMAGFVYVADDELPELGGTAPAYRLRGDAVQRQLLGDYPILDTRDAIARANADLAEPPTVETAPPPAVEPPAPACKPQPDGREICEPVDPGVTCPQVIAPADGGAGSPTMPGCTPPPPEPDDLVIDLPTPVAPAEVVLVAAEVVLVPMPATDGTGDTYLVPGYRFTDEHGGRVDLPAIADEAVAAPAVTEPPTTDTTAPGETTSIPTTSTTPPQPSDDLRPLGPDEVPQPGTAYYVDVQVVPHCGWIALSVAGRWWWADGLDLDAWATPTEGGTLVLRDDGRASFTGDGAATKVAVLVPYDGVGDRPLCA